MSIPSYYYVIHSNVIGGRLDCQGFDLIEEARRYIIEKIMPIYEPGDCVIIEETA